MSLVKLSKPIILGDSELTELTLREPTVDDVAEIGYPFLVITTDTGTAIQLQPKVVLKYAAKLAAVPPSSLKTLTLSDLSKLQEVVMGFFGDEAAAPQS
ncbi:MAG: phage tail assembly protein [Methylococcales bacterium]|nr:phage tail assembly protein [Methylococcales bacterium]